MILDYENDCQTFRNLDRKFSQTYRSLDVKRTEISANAFTPDVELLALPKKPRSKRKKDLANLQKLVSKRKVEALVTSFAGKMNRLRSTRPPIDISQPFDEENSLFKWLKQKEGFTLSPFSMMLWSIVNIIQLAVMAFVFSINCSFLQATEEEAFIVLRVISVVLYGLDMAMNFTVQIEDRGKKYVTLWKIGEQYVFDRFAFDFLSIFMFPISISVDVNLAPISLLITLIKLGNNIKRFEKYEYLIISNERERYYGLIKVFLTNFVIGHCLSILLNTTTLLSPGSNWHTRLGIEGATWTTKYLWGYYWGTNIMLTVGFGDISATNETEALFLIFIEIFSCIILAYNISNVGALISQIKADEELRKKQIKTFHRMSKGNDISTDLVERVHSFIEQSFQIKKDFEFDEFDDLLLSLPGNLRSQYRKESNNTLFDNIGFLSNMSKKTLLSLADVITRKIAHPEEIIRKKGDVPQFMILQMGQIALSCSNKSKILNGKNIDFITVKETEKPKIVSLDFIKGFLIKYNLKSVGYTILYHLDREEFANNLRKSEMDFQLFCTIRDKDNYLLGENEVYPCEICKKEYHNKFQCSRLHYVPFSSHVIAKYLYKEKISKQEEGYIDRSYSTLFKYPVLAQRKRQETETYRFMAKTLSRRQYDETFRIRRAHRFYQNVTENRQRTTKSEFELMQPTLKKNRIKSLIEPESNSMLVNIELIDRIQDCFYKAHNNSDGIEKNWMDSVDTVQSYRYYFSSYNIDEISRHYPKYMEDNLYPEMLFKL